MEIDENSDPAPSPTIVLSPEPPATFKEAIKLLDN